MDGSASGVVWVGREGGNEAVVYKKKKKNHDVSLCYVTLNMLKKRQKKKNNTNIGGMYKENTYQTCFLVFKHTLVM
jgi:hypothetical protein